MQSVSTLRKIYQYRFRPRLVPTIVTLMLLPLLFSLGQWQANKAERKQRLQQIYQQRAQGRPLLLAAQPLQAQDRYRKVHARGYYEPRYQILLDNQINQGQVGYQVVTPLRLEDGDMRVLVYRGWVPANPDRRILPAIETPSTPVEISGIADLPSGRYVELENQGQGAEWRPVWQNLDMARYRKAVPFPLQTMAIRLDADSHDAGGYLRDWPAPDLHIATNKGYAFQWYAMALMLSLYYLVTQFRKIKPRGDNHAS